MTFADIEEIFLEQMPGFYERDEIKAIACLAVQHVCQVNKSFFLLHKKTELTLVQETALFRILDELRFGKPLQHVLGEADFFGLKFKVNSSVLVPRPETEELVEWVLNSIKSENFKSATILDIGTGSGCIPIAIKRNAASCDVYSVDISKAALETARQNCVLNEVKINLIEGDILDTNFVIQDIKFDVIVSNPPYVRLSEKEGMSEHVLEHEPHEALFVSDADPLVFYRYIAEFSSTHLSPGGSVFLEINEGLSKETELLLQGFGFETQLRRDLQGKSRMIRAIKSE